MQCIECSQYLETKHLADRAILRCRDGMGGACEQDATRAKPCMRYEERGSAQMGLFEQ